MATILDMPQLSDTMKIGVLQKWRKNEGDAVSPGEVLAEVETDKAVMDFEAFDKGVLLKRLIKDGDSVPVGTPIAIIGKAGEDVAQLVEQAKARAAGGAKPAAAAAPAPAPKPAPAPAAAAPTPAPTPLKGQPSSRIRQRPVFCTDWTSSSSSSGRIVRGSTTSASIPSAASFSAAPSAIFTIFDQPMMVMSLPGRFTSATPSGMVYSPSGISPWSA